MNVMIKADLSEITRLNKEKRIELEKIEKKYNKKLYELEKEFKKGMYKLVDEPIYHFSYDRKEGKMSFITDSKLSKEVLLDICRATMMDLEDFQVVTSRIFTEDDGGLEDGIWLPVEYEESYRYIFTAYYYCETRSRIKWKNEDE